MLFESGRHEPLRAAAWDAARAHDAIRTMVADFEHQFDPARGWPAHPLDEAEAPATGFKSLYFGAAGTLWALWYLERVGAVTLRMRPAELVARLHADYVAEPDTEKVVPSYFLGEAGVLLVQWRLQPSSAVADRLFAAIRENIPNPTNEALWAAPGTMVAAWHMWKWTGEPRWRDLFVENVDHVWRLWQPSEHVACHLWTQDLYGRIVQLLGAGHGFAGNVDALLRGAELLSPERRAELYARCVDTLRVTAVHEGDGANWPSSVGPPRPGRTALLLQWCHGAPGIVTGLASFPRDTSAELEMLLRQGAHTVWEAGPLAKGHGLCHGTAGNGYAFLVLHQRTGEAAWLERARAFAMHALAQQQQMHTQYGRGRYTLWTGDPGLAVYLWHCMAGTGGMPGLDTLD